MKKLIPALVCSTFCALFTTAATPTWTLNNGPDAASLKVSGGQSLTREGLTYLFATTHDVTLTPHMTVQQAFAAAERPIFAVRYRITSPRKVGGLFFTTDTLTRLCDTSFTPFPIIGDGTWRHALVDMRRGAGAAVWRGRITSFRLDPLNPSAFGDEIEVSRLGFFPSTEAAEKFLAAANDTPAPRPAVDGTRVPRIDPTRFQIGAYCLNPASNRTDAIIRDIKACGIDFILCLPVSDTAALDLFAKHGVGVIASGVYPGWWGGDGARAGKMRSINSPALFRWYAKHRPVHPAIIAYDIGDEPSALDFPYYGEIVRMLGAAHPEMPVYLNLYPNYASVSENSGRQTVNQLGTKTYREHIDVYCRDVPLNYISYDFYPYLPTSAGTATFRRKMFDNFQIVADACRKTNRDFWYIPQVNSRIKSLHMSENMLRYQAHAAMAFGAVSISWGCYTAGWWVNNVLNADGTKNIEYDRLKVVNGELHRLAPAFMKYRNVATHFVGFPASEKLDSIGLVSTDALTACDARNLRATDGASLLVGEMTARQGKGQALFILAADDMEDRHPQTHTLTLQAKRPPHLTDATGVTRTLSLDSQGVARFTLTSNAAVLLEL